MSWPIVITLAAVGLAAVAALLWLWWWRFPKRQVDRLRLSVRDPKARADIEDNLRKTIGQLIGGTMVLIAAGLGDFGERLALLTGACPFSALVGGGAERA
jgi:ABC-type transport system involved in cytochrome c biogenesis permease subunit